MEGIEPHYEARQETLFEGKFAPASVVYIYRDEKGRKCTQFLAICSAANRDRDADAQRIAELLNLHGIES